jgi:hypothetical protein
MTVSAVHHCLGIYIVLNFRTGAAVTGKAGAGSVGGRIMGRFNAGPVAVQGGVAGGTAGNFTYSMISYRGIGMLKGFTVTIGADRGIADTMTVVTIIKSYPTICSGPIMVQ